MGFWDAAFGAGLSYFGGQANAKAAQSAANSNAQAIRQAANQAEKAALPWGIGGQGGTATWDQGSTTGLMNLSPELQDIYSGALNRSGLWGGQAMQYSDPFAGADAFYNQQQEYWQPREDQMRTDAETRLMSQGRLGTTGGMRAMGEIDESILGNQQQRQTQSFNQAQNLVNSLLGRESGDIGQAVGLLDIPIQYANVGQKVGGTLGSAATYGLQARNDAAAMMNQANATSAGGNALGALGGLFMDNARLT